MKRVFRLLFLNALLLSFAASIAACNTVKGAGRDIEKVGEEIQEEAEKHD